MTGLEIFHERFNNAIAAIQEYRIPTNDPNCLAPLVEWMLNTKACDYIAEGYFPYTAEDMHSLLRKLHNALYDDDIVSFVTVNGCPRIVFAHPSDFSSFDEFVQRSVLFDIEKSLIESYSEMPDYEFGYTVELLDIYPGEFGPLYDAHEVERARIDAEIEATLNAELADLSA